jgi:hypothetical protein
MASTCGRSLQCPSQPEDGQAADHHRSCARRPRQFRRVHQCQDRDRPQRVRPLAERGPWIVPPPANWSPGWRAGGPGPGWRCNWRPGPGGCAGNAGDWAAAGGVFGGEAGWRGCGVLVWLVAVSRRCDRVLASVTRSKAAWSMLAARTSRAGSVMPMARRVCSTALGGWCPVAGSGPVRGRFARGGWRGMLGLCRGADHHHGRAGSAEVGGEGVEAGDGAGGCGDRRVVGSQQRVGHLAGGAYR